MLLGAIAASILNALSGRGVIAGERVIGAGQNL